LALTTAGIDRQVFLLRDAEEVTWADFYHQFARALGIDLSQIALLPAPVFKRGLKDMAQQARATWPVQTILPVFPAPLKRSVKTALETLLSPATAPPSPWTRAPLAVPSPSEEMCLAQSCQVVLPIEKARKILGYKASVSFEEGCRRTIGWLKFAGYPITEKDTAMSGHDT
jgi:hypothetical protein